MPQQSIFLPEQWAIQGRVAKNTLKRLGRAAIEIEANIIAVKNGCICHWRDASQVEHRTLILSKRPTKLPTEATEVLITPDGAPLTSRRDWEEKRTKCRWISPVPAVVNEADLAPVKQACAEILESWRGQFSFDTEKFDARGMPVKSGLRPPQIGALHAVLAHWTVEFSPATIVMPTGTGKTETMLSLIVCSRLNEGFNPCAECRTPRAVDEEGVIPWCVEGA